MPSEQTQGAWLLTLLPELDRVVCAERRPADQEFAQLCRAHREWGARDRRIFGDVLFAWFRWRGWLAELLPTRPAAALALAGWLDGLVHPALCRLAAQADLELSSAVPERIAEKARTLSALLDTEKKIEQLVPDWTPALWGTAADASLEKHISAVQRRPPVWLRVAPTEVAAVLKFFGARATKHPRIASALAVQPPANLPGLRTATGITAIVQDLASQCVGAVCAPHSGERWWDACAGAGGKTLHLAAQMNNTGSILATDVRSAALCELERRAVEAGVKIIRTQHIEPMPVGAMFDGVLVDAPCSGIGTWSRNPDMRWRTTTADVTARAATQRQLLKQVAPHVRPGGVLVYAVCTNTRTETLDVLSDFFVAHAEFQPERFAHPLTGAPVAAGLAWVWPWDGPCDGMFIARLRRAG